MIARQSASPARRPAGPASAPLAAVALLSASALAYEVLLTRIFAIVHWHHLVELAISLALLGFGASGTFLVLASRLVRRHPGATFVANAVLFSIAAPLCADLAQGVAFDPEALLWENTEFYDLAAVFLLLAIPFFAAANAIGLALWTFDDQVARIYGVDLVGAGVGALLVLGGLAVWRPETLLIGIACGGGAAAILAARAMRWRPAMTTVVVLVTAVGLPLLAPPSVQPAAYKDASRALMTHGARTLQHSTGVDGSMQVVANDRIQNRSAPGLSLQSTALPPPQLAVFVDGDAAGSLADYRAPADTRYLADLVSALPYAVHPQPASVAVLDAGTGLRVQQAISAGAQQVTAVEASAQLVSLVCPVDAAWSRPVCDRHTVAWQVQSPRAFMAGSAARFDLVSLAVNADITGLDALSAGFAVTREALVDYLAHLAPDGVLAIEAPTRTPPRLWVRLLATARAALHERGIGAASDHVAMLRGWQRAVMLISPRPLDDARLAATRRFSQRLGFDLVWLPGMHVDEANRYQQLASPVFHDRARAILTGPWASAAAHVVSDDRPFPRLSSDPGGQVAAFATGDRADRRALDSGVIVAATTLALASGAAILLIIAPLAIVQLRRRGRVPARLAVQTWLFFTLIGIAFLFTEIAWIQRLQLFLGHPVYATTAVLSAFLVFAGLGSLWAQRRAHLVPARLLGLAVALIVVSALGYLVLLPGAFAHAAGSALWLRITVAVALLAPLAFAMGMPFPLALHALGTRAPALVPWAWGINGCTSVIAAASAPLFGAAFGFSGLIITATAAYALLPLVRLVRRR